MDAYTEMATGSMTTTLAPTGQITYRVDRKVELIPTPLLGTYQRVARSWTTFHAPDGTRVTLNTSALMMALAMSGVQLHREMTLSEIAWACVAGVRAAGGPAMVEHRADQSRQISLTHVNTNVWRDPEYKRMWGSRKRYGVCFSLVHHELVGVDVPAGRDITLDVEPAVSAVA